jgi:hypothetical protein
MTPLRVRRAVHGVDRPRRMNPRAMRRRAEHAENDSWPTKAIQGPKAPVPVSSRDMKRELLELARAAGWRGRSYRSAKKFDRKLTRQERAS